MAAIDSRLRATAYGLPGLTTKKALTVGIEEGRQILIGELPALLLPGRDGHDLHVVVLEMRHLEVGREDRGHHRDGVARIEQPVGFERLEDVAHRRRAALDGVEAERARRAGLAAHRPLQILAHDALVVHEHAIRHRIVVADDRVDQFVHEGVGVEIELLHRPRHHGSQQSGAWHVAVRLQPGDEAGGNPRGFRHSPDPSRQLQRALALGDGELAEEEEGRAGLGRDPVRISPARVEIRDL